MSDSGIINKLDSTVTLGWAEYVCTYHWGQHNCCAERMELSSHI